MNRRYVCKRGHSEYPVFITIYTNQLSLEVATSTDAFWVSLADFLWLLYFLIFFLNAFLSLRQNLSDHNF
jgi:hypothetical protein